MPLLSFLETGLSHEQRARHQRDGRQELYEYMQGPSGVKRVAQHTPASPPGARRLPRSPIRSLSCPSSIIFWRCTSAAVVHKGRHQDTDDGAYHQHRGDYHGGIVIRQVTDVEDANNTIESNPAGSTLSSSILPSVFIFRCVPSSSSCDRICTFKPSRRTLPVVMISQIFFAMMFHLSQPQS